MFACTHSRGLGHCKDSLKDPQSQPPSVPLSLFLSHLVTQQGKSDNEVMRFCQSFMTELSK